jgi:ribonuclease J
VFVPLAQRIRVKQAEDFWRIADIRARRLYPEDLASRASELVMTFRPSMARDLERADCLTGARAVWSMWAGYLDDRSGVRLRQWLEQHRIPFTVLHGSGHARVEDLQRFAAAVGARQVVPMHTTQAGRYPDLFDNVVPYADGEWWEV